MTLKVIVSNCTREEKELMQWAKQWMEKLRKKGKKVIAKKKITH